MTRDPPNDHRSPSSAGGDHDHVVDRGRYTTSIDHVIMKAPRRAECGALWRGAPGAPGTAGRIAKGGATVTTGSGVSRMSGVRRARLPSVRTVPGTTGGTGP